MNNKKYFPGNQHASSGYSHTPIHIRYILALTMADTEKADENCTSWEDL